jgi:hypothetical protein
LSIGCQIYVRTDGCTCNLHFAGFLLGLLFDQEDRGRIFLQNICELLSDYTVLIPKDDILQPKILSAVSQSSANILYRVVIFKFSISIAAALKKQAAFFIYL